MNTHHHRTLATLVAVATVATVGLAACSPATPAQSGSSSPTASAATAGTAPSPSSIGPTAASDTFAVTSADIAADGTFDDAIVGAAYAWCDGPGKSPQITWSDPPAGTQSFALLMENLTHEGGFNYWLQYNIDPTERGVARSEYWKLSGEAGKNSGDALYPVSPCPEPGETHNIQITVYALDTVFESSVDSVAEAAAGHTLAQSSVTGTVQGPPVAEATS